MNRIGVCSWSLCPTGPADLATRVRATGLKDVQLALDPLREGDWSLEETRRALDEAGLRICSGMMGTAGEDYSTLETIRETGGFRDEARWPENLERVRGNARVARDLGLRLVSFHAGFLPEGGTQEGDPLLERIRTVADIFGDVGVQVALETGQETALDLASFLEHLKPTVGINFDPANMILYDKGDPIEALEALLPRVLQIHVKDATRTAQPGTWGREVVVGRGEVNWRAFFEVLERSTNVCDLIIEREAGQDRQADIQAAHELVQRHLGAAPR